jgi:hypothetical protein
MSRVEDQKIREKFERITQMRFETISQIKEWFVETFDCECNIIKSKNDPNSDFFSADYELIGTLMHNELELYTFDLYYLRDRHDQYYITEIGYEEE